MKDGSFLRRRLSLGPATSTPQKSDPRKLSRNLLFGVENDLFPFSPGKDVEGHNPLVLQDEEAQTLVSISKAQQTDYKFCNGIDRDRATPTPEVARKERLKVQKHNYRQEKKRVTKQLVSALRDPSVAIMADWLKIRGALKSWTRLWCVLKPGALLLYKTPKMDHWVGTVLLHSCELIERPSKKDGVCFKLFHPLDQSIWAVKGPEGENVGSITQPLPSSHLIFRASESDGHCWLDALELALCCSSLFRLSTAKNGKDGEPDVPGDPAQAPLNGLLLTSTLSDHELFQLNDAALENGGLSDRWGREPAEESENEGPRGDRKASESEQSESPGERGSAGTAATTYVEQAYEEMGEPGGSSQTETVSEENKGLMWPLLKQLRPGMDLSRVVLPTFVLEPRSFLNKLSDYYYHADLLSRAAQEEDPYCRLKHVLRWYLSGFYKKPKGIKKPYNPILGETFRCRWYHPQTNSHTFYVAEQVSHHPPVSAFHVSNRKDGFCVSGSVLAKSRFYGNSLSALLDGQATLTFLRQEEEYVITMPYAHCKGILYGTMTMELGGKVTVSCAKNNYQAELEFKLKPFFGGISSLNQISGKIKSGDEVLANLYGHWDGEVLIQDQKQGSTDVFWNPTREVRRQRLKRHTVLLEEQAELESERLWRHVSGAIHRGDQLTATQEKLVLEEGQRARARARREAAIAGAGEDWSPKLFWHDATSHRWRYRYEDLRPWDPQHDLAQFEKDGILQTERRPTPLSRPPHTPSKGSAQSPRARKASDQPSTASQTTDSSGSTPESAPDLSDDSGASQGSDWACARCGQEAGHLREIQEAVLTLQKTQQDIHSHLAALNKKALRPHAAPAGFLHSPRLWFLTCVFLTCQLVLNYTFK
ncbi:oxysterol-binding protein-related protein 5 [Ornithorhynchus anatinus]|uniref:Oxysterol-binding protein n=1 Tax=Ornithorhynchus anatinus TaxID=9258 RepID=A0A6I8NSZ9_ORNAN|nr:oxysterol-binding protein-related protein 5 [Ornithorhynchus anatinus]